MFSQHNVMQILLEEKKVNVFSSPSLHSILHESFFWMKTILSEFRVSASSPAIYYFLIHFRCLRILLLCNVATITIDGLMVPGCQSTAIQSEKFVHIIHISFIWSSALPLLISWKMKCKMGRGMLSDFISYFLICNRIKGI